MECRGEAALSSQDSLSRAFPVCAERIPQCRWLLTCVEELMTRLQKEDAKMGRISTSRALKRTGPLGGWDF